MGYVSSPNKHHVLNGLLAWESFPQELLKWSPLPESLEVQNLAQDAYVDLDLLNVTQLLTLNALPSV